MAKYFFTTEQIAELRKNPNVASVTTGVLTFTADFKKHAYDERHRHKSMRQIFEEAGFDIDIIGIKRIENFTAALEKQAMREAGFEDLRKDNRRREPTTPEASMAKQMRHLEHKVAYLEQENAFLKKIANQGAGK